MARILLTSGPTREYLDPVRYLTNASSGRMGAALAQAAVAAGHQVVIVSGPVGVTYPPEAEVISVVSTEKMLEACRGLFPRCDGMIAAAAPCDYRPETFIKQKIHKTGDALELDLVETPDIVAKMAAAKTSQWIVAFALETEHERANAMRKLERKNCDMILLNGPEAIHADDTRLVILGRDGQTLGTLSGDKPSVAKEIIDIIGRELINKYAPIPVAGGSC